MGPLFTVYSVVLFVQSVASRVAEELGVKLGEEVGYTIRFEDLTNPVYFLLLLHHIFFFFFFPFEFWAFFNVYIITNRIFISVHHIRVILIFL